MCKVITKRLRDDGKLAKRKESLVHSLSFLYRLSIDRGKCGSIYESKQDKGIPIQIKLLE
ncbi:hypothetical protein CN552_16370 [Bacillus wiedmannii]|nr:hypothetical protein CN552_16370 [Bacillus wiedmannii]